MPKKVSCFIYGQNKVTNKKNMTQKVMSAPKECLF